MQKTMLWAALAAFALPGMAGAEVLGANVGVSYSGLADGHARDTHKMSLGGAVEYAFSPSFSIQGDVAQRYYGAADWKGTTGTLHAIFHNYNGAAFGAFYGHDWIRGTDANNYGVEFANSVNLLNYQAFAGYTNGTNEKEGTMLGLQADYGVNDRLRLGGKYAMINNHDDLQRLSATATYAFPQGFQLDGELGLTDQKDSDKEAFIGIGLKATFGGGQNVTFDERGYQALLPGD